MAALTRNRAATLVVMSCAACSQAGDPGVLYAPPGGWDQNGYWNSTFTQLVPSSSPGWAGPRLMHETFNANNHLSLAPRTSPSPCTTTAPVSIRGSNFENGIGIGPRIWLDDSQRWLLHGESVTYAATLRNDAGWSIPVTITALRMHDLSVEGVDGIVSPTYDVTLRRDSSCAVERLGVNQLGPVPVVTLTTARFTAAPGAYAYYKTYFSGQQGTEAVPAKVMVNAGLLQPMPGEPDDFYQTCGTLRPVAANQILFNASYAFSAMTWLDVVGSALLDTGVQMTRPGQRIRIHMLGEGEAICHRRGFPGRRVGGLGPPWASEPNPTSIDVVQVDDTQFLADDIPVTAGHHALQGTSSTRAEIWSRTSTDPDRFTYQVMKEAKVRAATVGNVTGMVASWQQVVNLLAVPAAGTATMRARLFAVAVTPPADGAGGHFETPAEQTQNMDWCGSGYCWPGETVASCPVDCAPPPLPGGMDAGVTDAFLPMDAGVTDAFIPIDAGHDAATFDAMTMPDAGVDAWTSPDAGTGPDAGP